MNWTQLAVLPLVTMSLAPMPRALTQVELMLLLLPTVTTFLAPALSPLEVVPRALTDRLQLSRLVALPSVEVVLIHLEPLQVDRWPLDRILSQVPPQAVVAMDQPLPHLEVVHRPLAVEVVLALAVDLQLPDRIIRAQ